MPILTLKYGTFTNSSGQSTFHMALIISSPEVNFIVQSDENGNLSSIFDSEISREYSFTKSFEITAYEFTQVRHFIRSLLDEISINQNYKCGTYVLFFLRLANLFPEKRSGFPTEIPLQSADYLYDWWDANVEEFRLFAEIIDEEFTPELMVKLIGLLQQKVLSTPITALPKLDSKTEIDPEPDNRIKFFKRIYQELRHAESSFFRKDFLKGKDNLSANQLQSEIEREVLNYPDGQVNLAWRLAESYAHLNDSSRTHIHTAYKPQLFFSICKQSIHTFVTVSVQDKIFKKNFILFATTMSALNIDNFSLYKTVPGGIINANCKELRKITYQSFEITTEQYAELLGHVATNVNIDDLFPPPSSPLEPPVLELKNVPSAYQPCPQSPVEGQDKVKDDKRPLHFIHDNIIDVQDRTKEQIATELNPNSPYNKYNFIWNNCRHAGIALFNATFKAQQGEKLFSSIALIDFPHTGLIYKWEFIGNHYILPAPPIKGDLDPKLYKILARLYKRLEEIPKLKPDSQLTMDKFNALKDLYHSLAPAQPLRLEQLLTVINTWESTGKNKDIVDTHRGIKFFSNTSTRNSITELKTLAEIKPPSCSWFGCS